MKTRLKVQEQSIPFLLNGDLISLVIGYEKQRGIWQFKKKPDKK